MEQVCLGRLILPKYARESFGSVEMTMEIRRLLFWSSLESSDGNTNRVNGGRGVWRFDSREITAHNFFRATSEYLPITQALGAF